MFGRSLPIVAVIFWLMIMSFSPPLVHAQIPQVASQKPTYKIVDLMPDFWDFYSKAQGLEPDKQAALFSSTLVRKFPLAYGAKIIGLDAEKPYDVALGERYRLWRERITPQHIEIARRLSQSIGRDLSRYEARFRETFSDFSYSGTVYFMASLLGFDGATRTIEGKTVLLFGLDTMAFVYGASLDPQPFFHHELFHVYHAQHLGDTDANPTIMTALWTEGLAVYVSKKLNPETEGISLFGLPEEMPAQTQARVKELSAEILRVLESTKPNDYRTYFTSGGTNADVPKRCGYYIGYLVAQEIGRNLAVQEMAKLSLEAARPLVIAALKKLSTA
jgi:hypothetical protein